MRSSAEHGVRAAALVVAGGSGRRMGACIRKQYLEIGGEPVLLRALRPFLAHPAFVAVIAVLPEEDAASPPEWLAALGATVIAGGPERGDSVWNGLAALPGGVERVLIHDGARPFVSRAVVDRVLSGCGERGVVAAVPVTDTIKEVDPNGVVVGSPARTRLWRAQTPQGFPCSALVEAYRAARRDGFAATDDASVFARYAGEVRVVEGAEENLKVTTPPDLVVAEAIAQRWARVG